MYASLERGERIHAGVRVCACRRARAFVHEARSQTLSATDNATQRKHYGCVGTSCWAYTSKDTRGKKEGKIHQS